MENVEILVGEEGTLKIVRHYDLRVLRRRRRENELQRRLVVGWRSCRRSCSQDPTFCLKGLFVFTLICVVIRIPYERFITYTLYNFGRRASYRFELLWYGILFVATITTVSVLWLLTMEVKRTAPSWRKAELQSVSGLVQHL